MTPAAKKYLDQNPLKAVLGIPEQQLRDCSVRAYECCRDGHYQQAEVIGRGLVAVDHRNWYYRSLLAVSLDKLGRRPEAREVVQEGLRFSPAEPELLKLRAALA